MCKRGPPSRARFAPLDQILNGWPRSADQTQNIKTINCAFSKVSNGFPARKRFKRI